MRLGVPLLVVIAGLSALLGALLVSIPWLAALLGPLAVVFTVGRLSFPRLLPKPVDLAFRQRLAFWTVLAFLLHIGIGTVINFLPQAHYYFGPDAATYSATAQQLAEHWRGARVMPSLPPGKEGFYYLLAGLYRIVGPHEIAGLVVNAGLGAALVPLAAKISHRLFGMTTSRYVPPLVVFLPGLLLWPSLLLRESGAIFLIALSTYAALELIEKTNVVRVLLGSLPLALLFTFRGPVGLVVAAALVVALAIGKRSLLGGILSSLLGLSVLVVVVFAGGIGEAGYKNAVGTDVESVMTYQKNTATAGSGFTYENEVASPLQVLSRLPMAVLRFLFGPSPGELSLSQAPAAVDAMAAWLSVPFLVVGLLHAKRQAGRKVLVLVLPIVGLTSTLSLAVGNYGLLLRERTQVTILLVPLIALGIAKIRERSKVPPRPTRPPAGNIRSYMCKDGSMNRDCAAKA